MHSSTITLVFSLAALAAAVPHSLNRQRLHSAADNRLMKLAPVVAGLVERDVAVDLVTGQCGGSTGFGCPAGFCCSQWGYCGQGAQYCGADSKDSADGPSTAQVSKAPAVITSAASSAWETGATPTTAAETSWTSAASTTAAATPAYTSVAPSPSSGSSSGSSGYGNVFKMYSGNGDASQGWPSMSDWSSFDAMWSENEPFIMKSCTQFGEANNSEEETQNVKSAIQSVGGAAGVDPRFILAIVMQESSGCVRAPTTNYGVTNPGLMQSHDGSGSCNNGAVQNPCPMSEITQMITDGVDGTSSGAGLKQCLAQSPAAGSANAAEYYQAARIYNSGSIASSGNLDDGIATQCYSADVANRLTGWTNAPTQCFLSS